MLADRAREKIKFWFPRDNAHVPEISVSQSDNQSLEIYADNKRVVKVDRSLIHRTQVKISTILRKLKKQGYHAVSAGIDLTGSETRASCVCILSGRNAYLDRLKTDAEIISRVDEAKPTVISIDSPLSLPIGRDCTSDSCECRKFGITRECERLLKKRGINSYPCLIKSMQGLTARGIKLAKIFKDKGYLVIESYPGAAQDVMGLPRKKVDLRGLEIDLMNMGIKPISERTIISHDEIDALTSALVGYFYLIGTYECLGNETEGYLVIPRI
jgi:predicted nuclease with RNAse H fold